MKTMTSTLLPFTLTLKRWSMFAKMIVAGMAAFLLLNCPPVHGATLNWKVSNATVYFGLPSASLEFENPLAGTETVMGHAVLEWRDADYAFPPAWYDDWNVNPAGGTIDGDANEIWMRQAGQSIWTTTTVPSTIISIHMTGDSNDGLADVLVDGTTVASLNMWNAVPGGTVLIIVKGLTNTTHTIEIDDVSIAALTDVHTFGAAALKESPIKWDQPPDPAHPTNIFYGWNELSQFDPPAQIVADDWVCTTTNPVTDIHWWGSFLNWTEFQPPAMPIGFMITIWTDVPTNTANPFSHPGEAIWTNYCTSFTWEFAGWDYDPRTGMFETCYKFEQDLLPQDWFYQQQGPTGTNIYWISIAAVQPPWPWGWKTRPRDPTSPAPDDAVRGPSLPFPPPPDAWNPIWWPTETNSWDMAFELTTMVGSVSAKWEQVPDLSTNGIDVNDTAFPPPSPPNPPPYLLADDFLCTEPGPITNITIWGSWFHDYHDFGVGPSNVTFTLSIHADIPPFGPPWNTNYSMPGPYSWLGTFGPAQYTCSLYETNILEGWLNPPTNYTSIGDFSCWQYDFNIPPGEAFYQQGTPTAPVVYWLDVQAQLPFITGSQVRFGWKTCPTNWNDDAVWVTNREPYIGLWNRLTYPPGHMRAGQTLDLAFRLNAVQDWVSGVKWSQPPVPYSGSNMFNGWNQWSVFDQPIVADDWVCISTNPVTDIHWWGSFIGWSHPSPPPEVPAGFLLGIWTDVPTNTIEQFSHPGLNIWQNYCTNFTWQFVGWDIDPRIPSGLGIGTPPEACFKFEQDLLEHEWFYQNPDGLTNIYWISIAAVYTNQTIQYPWGWKTRPRDTNSLAPDDAVWSSFPFPPPLEGWNPIYYQNDSWDVAFQLTTRRVEEQDFGDAPDPTYPTLLANNGARHFIVPGFNLGTNIDAELDGQPHPLALGDDLGLPLDDEDGVTWPAVLLVNTQNCVGITLTSPTGTGQLDAWLDLNRNGTWEPAEQIITNQTILSGSNYLCFPVPCTARPVTNYARFRLSSAGGLLPAGAAADGEVEDYQVILRQPRPLTNIVITNIVVTNVVVGGVPNQAVTLRWRAESCIHYQLQATATLTNAVPLPWVDVGPEVIGPANTQSETNTLRLQRYYRVMAPWVWP